MNPIASRVAYKSIMYNWKNILRRYSRSVNFDLITINIPYFILFKIYFRFHDSYSVIRSFILAMMNSVTNEQDLMDVRITENYFCTSFLFLYFFKSFFNDYNEFKSYDLLLFFSHFQLHTFWENNYESIKTVKYAAALVESKANLAISLIKNYSHEIKEWLKDNNDSGA